jgi:signal recognition particle receptor subunit beta
VAFTNFETKEINCKIVYFGGRGCGKSENLRSIYKSTSAEVRSGLIELDAAEGPTRFFDFLPLSLGHVRDFHLKLHLFTLPTNTLYESVQSVILKGIDGYVFVADSRVEAMADNVEAMKAARRLLTEEGVNVADMPRVIQFNKQDLPDLVPLPILRQELNAGAIPDHRAIATESVGTLETLQSLAKLVLKKIAP